MRIVIATKDGIYYRTDRLGNTRDKVAVALELAREDGFLELDYYEPDRRGLEAEEPSTRVFLRNAWIPWDNIAGIVTVGLDAQTVELGEDGWAGSLDVAAGVEPYRFEADVAQTAPDYAGPAGPDVVIAGAGGAEILEVDWEFEGDGGSGTGGPDIVPGYGSTKEPK